MGYRTTYNLTIYHKKTYEVICDIEIINKIEQFYNVILNDENKWYDHIKDMTKFSKKYPEYYFYFANYGEGVGDIWLSLFHNGKSCEVDLDPQFPSINELIGSLR